MAGSTWRAALPRLLQAVRKLNSRGASPQPRAPDSPFDLRTGFKIIEKDDPESCNHMTRKNTDVMPCTRERTDFCSCLCGNQFAVTPARWRGSVEQPTHSLISTQVIVVALRYRPTTRMRSSTSWKQCRNQNSITYLTHWLISHQARYTSLSRWRIPGLSRGSTRVRDHGSEKAVDGKSRPAPARRCSPRN